MLRTAEDAKQPFLFRITPGNVKTVGRAPRADFVVDAALVSRLHCRLAAGAAEIEATDLKSTNGTYVNGARVDRATLRDGDRLRVGAVELLVVKAGSELERQWYAEVPDQRPIAKTDSSAAPARSSSAPRGPNTPLSHPDT
jgi:pSer/pThr/pTyr-binding forkhead associated (FHA) protein